MAGTSISDWIAGNGYASPPTSRAVSAGTGLTGGGTLAADHTIAVAPTVAGAPQLLSGAGAIDVVSRTTYFTSTGSGQALSLADGTYAGQRKSIEHSVDGGSGVITPATAGNFATFTLTSVGDSVELEWTGTAWNHVSHVGGTLA